MEFSGFYDTICGMERREAVGKTTICRFGKKLTSTSNQIFNSIHIKGFFVIMKYALLFLFLLVSVTSCRHNTHNFTNTTTSLDPIEALFNITSPVSVRKIDGKPITFLKVSPKAHVDAGVVLAESPWEQEFVLEVLEGGVEIGETTAKCDSPLAISFIKESDKIFRLTVTITPKLEQSDFRCQVKIPVIEPQGSKGLDLLITGKVRI